MARFRVRQQDVDRFVSEYRRTRRILDDAKASMTAQGVPEFVVDEVVPELPDVGNISEMGVEELGLQFLTRSDYNRVMRYMERLQRESKKDVVTDESKNVTQLGHYGNLTAVKGDLNVDYEGVQLRYERRLLERGRLNESLRRLESMGISMRKSPIEKVDPETGEVSTAYSESRHPLYTYVPSTLEDLQRYREAIQRNETLAIIPPDELPENAIVEQLGSSVPLRARQRRMRPTQVSERIGVDTMTDVRTSAYFANYGAIADTVLPNAISDEINAYVGAIMDLPPQRRMEIYEMIEDSPDDAGTIEYMYLDRSGTLSSKVQTILGYWRSNVAPKIGMGGVYDSEIGSFTDVLENAGFNAGSGQNVYDEYQMRKRDGESVSISFADVREMLRNG